MTVMGLDPGPQNTAWCLWNGHKILDAGIATNPALLGLIQPNQEQIIACEHLQCMGMPVGATTFETAYFIGELRYLCARQYVMPFVRVFRSEIKSHFCHSMRAKDSNIAQALRDRFGGKGTKKNPGFFYGFKADMWSAFAIAVYAWDKAQQ